MAASGGYAVEAAFLELGEPDLAGAAGRLVSRGSDSIVVIPYFLTLGTHLQRDLPRLVEDAARRHGNIPMRVTSPLDGHPALLQALLDRAGAALSFREDRMKAMLVESHEIAPEVRHFVFEVTRS